MKRNKAFSIALSIVIAFGLWLYVVTSVTPEDSTWVYNIPVTFENEDGLFSDLNLMITQGSNTVINLKLHGKRSDLMKLNRSNISITVDLNGVTGPGEWDLAYEYQLPDSVQASAITLEDKSISRVHLEVEKLETKSVEVRAVFSGEVASGYMADAIETQYDTLEVSGPEDVISSISYAEVVLERTNLSKTVTDSLPVSFYDENDKAVDSDEINCEVERMDVIMPVSMVKEVPLTVTLSSGGGATEEHAVVDITPQTVTLKGDAELLENLNYINLGTIDLGSIEESYSKTFTVIVPDDATNLSDTEATVNVELVNLKEKTVRVTNIEIANAPEGMSVVLGAASLQVKLRGGSSVIDSISGTDVRAVVDMNLLGATTGQFNVPVSIYVDGYSDVGAMGSYNILVTISEEVITEESAVAVSEEASGTAASTAGTEDTVKTGE